MSYTIELTKRAFQKAKECAEKNGMTPDSWVEEIIEKETDSPSVNPISETTRKELNDFDRRMKKGLGEMWREKFRRELAMANGKDSD